MGDAAYFRWRPDPQDRYAQNLGAVVAAARSTAQRVAEARTAGQFALVLGGDCTVGVGTVAGLAAAGERTGLLYFDMHPDLNVPSSVPDGALDWMGLAHMLGLPGAREELRRLLPQQHALEPDRVLLFGVARDQCTPHELGAIAELPLELVERDAVSRPCSAPRADLDCG